MPSTGMRRLRLHGGGGGIARNSERREMGADRVGDVARREVRIVLFCHPRIGVSEISCNYRNRRPGLPLADATQG